MLAGSAVFVLWLVGLGIALKAFAPGVQIWRSLRGVPEKREVTMVDQYATKEELAVTEKVLSEKITHVETNVAQLRQEIRVDTIRLHERIDPIGIGVAEMKSTLELVNQRMVQIDTKLDREIERELVKRRKES